MWVLEMYRSDPTSGLGTWKWGREELYWKGMHKDAEELVHSHTFYCARPEWFNVHANSHIRMGMQLQALPDDEQESEHGSHSFALSPFVGYWL